MSINDLKTRLNSEKLILGAIEVEIGRKCSSPNIIGIFEENGVWSVYDTNDRGGIVILDKGSENDMADALYRRILKIDKKNRKKMGI